MKNNIQELRAILYKMNTPKMDGSNHVNHNDIKRLLIKISHEYEELEKQNKELEKENENLQIRIDEMNRAYEGFDF